MSGLRQKKDAASTISASATLLDTGQPVARFDFSVTADRQVRLTVTTPEDPEAAFIGFTAHLLRGEL
jgi:hypothetical protein